MTEQNDDSVTPGLFEEMTFETMLRRILNDDRMIPEFFVNKRQAIPIYTDEEHKYSWRNLLARNH